MPRLLAPRVPARFAFISARPAPNTSPSRVTCFEDLPVLSSRGALTLGMSLLLPDLDEGVLRAGHGALDQEQAVLCVDLVDDETHLGHTLAAQPSGHLHALEDARRSGRRADRPRLADVVRAVRLRGTVAPVALDRPRGALADRDARDLDRVAGLESLHGHGLADGQLGTAAELDQLAMRLHAVLGQMPELALRDLALGDGVERELHGVVAVRGHGLDLDHGARAGLSDRYRGDDARLRVEDLRHTEFPSDDPFHFLPFSQQRMSELDL